METITSVAANPTMLDLINNFLATKGIYSLVLILMFLGMFGMIIANNYMKKMMAMNVMQVAVILFFLCFAQKTGGMIPILNGITTDPNLYINPLPHALMLTAIVVSLGTTGVAIALLMRIKETYGSVEEDDILRRADR
jgi:multicomponent Na+:H+ antiporter subunit C